MIKALELGNFNRLNDNQSLESNNQLIDYFQRYFIIDYQVIDNRKKIVIHYGIIEIWSFIIDYEGITLLRFCWTLLGMSKIFD